MPIDLKNQVISGTEILTQIFIISQKKKIGEPKNPQQFSFIFFFFGQTLFRHPERCEFWRNESRAEKCNYCKNKNNSCANKCNYCEKKGNYCAKNMQLLCKQNNFYCTKNTIDVSEKKTLIVQKNASIAGKKQLLCKKKTIIVEKIRFRRNNTHVQAAF